MEQTVRQSGMRNLVMHRFRKNKLKHIIRVLLPTGIVWGFRLKAISVRGIRDPCMGSSIRIDRRIFQYLPDYP